MPEAAPARLLILGGTSEAVALARAAVDRYPARLEVITSLAGRTMAPRAVAGRVRVGGFGGAGGLAAYLRAEGIDLVIDATHPFAATIAANAAAACAETGTPRLKLLRAPWRPQPGDDWRAAADFAAAARALESIGRRVFLSTGPGNLDAFARLAGIWFLVRLLAPATAPLPLANYATVVGRPPFSVEAETALLASQRIDTLVSKQSGGPGEAKLAAARALGVRVIMIRRPPPPTGAQVETVDRAFAWLAGRLGGSLTSDHAPSPETDLRTDGRRT